MARRVLIAEVLIVGTITLAMLVREIPGMRRELRMWRMVGLRRH
ncbi:hypothetical protein AB0F92_17710 [Kitasatospora aureofaciens]|uniref:Uncharacterized protein n=1 Tax=Kitasatospora aureofaciens TaxID=1894 RepID=A0A8H9LRA0_KITAU|nr:hypothetical protein [Kitasatospora aureofaciens]GGU87979.1 hypothetical protein GCM10010502_45670 [Kitasatospora aureofaciens]